MSLYLESPILLLLLALVPATWWLAGDSRTPLGEGRQRASRWLRCALVAALGLALSGPVLQRSGEWLALVWTVDVSSSVGPTSVERAAEWIEAVGDGGADDAVHLAFAGKVAKASDASGLLELAARSGAGRRSGIRSPDSTDLTGAVTAAVAAVPAGHAGRVVLFTDGRGRDAPPWHLVEEMRRRGIRLYANPVEIEPPADVWVESVTAPGDSAVDEPFALQVGVRSSHRTRASLELWHLGDVGDAGPVGLEAASGALLGRRDVELEPGLNRVAFDVTLARPGPQTLEARIVTEGPTPPGASGDFLALNDARRLSVRATDRPTVLYVEGRPASAAHLTAALQQQGLVVEVRRPAAMPASAGGLDAFDAVVLSDVRAGALPAGAMAALETYVRDLGGGFVMVGGDNVFGEEGYSETPVEDVLPVEFSIRRERRDLALVIVLDKSYSMVGDKIELAKEATVAALEVLEDEHRFGLLTFNYDPYWTVPIQAAVERETMRGAIRRVQASAHTNIYPALEEAYVQLADTGAKVKHVILLSDGKTYPDAYDALVGRMADADITVSTVAVGEEADRELLADIARWGNGRAYFIEDAARVPRIFTEEARIASRASLREHPFRPRVRQRSDVLAGLDLSTAPPLRGYLRLQADDTAEVLLETADEDPLLVRWQYGLGRAAAFTSDVVDRWAAEWLAWPGYGKFWGQLVRDVLRRQEDAGLDVQVRRVGQEAWVTVTARDGLRGVVHRISPDGSTAVAELRQTGPGVYRARLPLPAVRLADGRPVGASHLIRLTTEDGGATARRLPVDYPDEYRLLPTDVETLRAMAEATGGAYAPTVEQLLSRPEEGEAGVRTTDLWPWLAALALLLYVAELSVRRLPTVQPLTASSTAGAEAGGRELREDRPTRRSA